MLFLIWLPLLRISKYYWLYFMSEAVGFTVSVPMTSTSKGYHQLLLVAIGGGCGDLLATVLASYKK